MSSGSINLGALAWTIDADDTAFNAKLDRAEARARSFGASINSVIGGGPGGSIGGPATFGGPISGGGNTVGQIGRTGFGTPALPALQALPGRALENEVWLAETKQWFAQNANRGAQDEDAAGGERGGAGSLIRPIAVYHMAMMIGREVVQDVDRDYQTRRVLSRGTMAQQVARGVSDAQFYDSGLTGILSRAGESKWGAFISPVSWIINKAKGGSTGEIHDYMDDMAAAAEGMSAIDATRTTTRNLNLSTGFMTASPFQRLAAGAYGTYNKAHDQAVALRQQAIGLTGKDSATANQLMNAANALEAGATTQWGTSLAQSGRQWLAGQMMGGVAAGATTLAASAGFLTQIGAANIAATGNQFGAQIAQMRGEFAQEELGQTNPVLKFMMKAAHAAILGAAQVGHERQLGFQTGQVTAATLGAAAQMPDIGIEESSRRERLALEQRRDIELAQYKAANPADVAGQSARADYWKGQLELNEANKQAAVYRRDVSTAGAIRSAQLVVSGQPLAATINDIRTQTQVNVTAAGGATTPAGQQQQQLGAAREALAQYQNASTIEQLDLGITGQGKALKQLLQNPSDPIAAQSTTAAYGALAKAAELNKGGFQDQASGVLDNALSEQYLIQKDYLKSFRAFQFDTRENVFNPRDTADVGKTLSSIDENIQKLADQLLVEQ